MADLSQENNAKPKTKAGEHLSKIMKEFYIGQHMDAQAGKFCVWAAIIVPLEILRGFDIIVGIPENYSAMTASKGAGPIQCERSHQLGFSPDLCSYARIDLGNNLHPPKDAQMPPLPKPNLVITDNNNCSLLAKWFDVYHREYNIPHFILDVPFCYDPQDYDGQSYIHSQYKDLIRKIENMTGQKHDMDKTREAMNNTNEALKHWKRFMKAALHKPAGITAFDSFVQMATFVTLRGTSQLVEQYKLLADETEERVAEKIFPIPDEKYRLLWDNIAPWHQLRKMSGRLKQLDANIVYATYTSCLGTIEGGVDLYEYDGIDPLKHLARTQNFSVCPYGLELRYKVLEQLVENCGIDGVVFANNKSCKVYSLMQMDLQKRLIDKLKIPSIMIDVDHADVTRYSEEGVFIRIEALLEQIDRYKDVC